MVICWWSCFSSCSLLILSLTFPVSIRETISEIKRKRKGLGLPQRENCTEINPPKHANKRKKTTKKPTNISPKSNYQRKAAENFLEALWRTERVRGRTGTAPLPSASTALPPAPAPPRLVATLAEPVKGTDSPGRAVSRGEPEEHPPKSREAEGRPWTQGACPGDAIPEAEPQRNAVQPAPEGRRVPVP